MKTRNGWVSNSSSSSFLIYGAYVTTEKMLEAFSDEEIKNMFDDNYKSYVNEDGSVDREDFLDEVDDDYVIAEKFCDKVGLNFSGLPNGYNSQFAIGFDPSNNKNFPDNETMGQFKKKIHDKLEAIGIPADDIGWYSEAWFDG